MKEIVFAGFGGQGVLLGGQILAQMAADNGLQSTWMPSYGVSMRGGTANCVVHISEGDIYSPGMEEIDILLALNIPSLEKFKNDVVPGGYIFFNSDSGEIGESTRNDVNYIIVPGASLANQVADARSTNAVVLGVMLEKLKLFGYETARKSIGEYFERTGKSEVAKLVWDAFDAGCKWAADNL